MNRYVVEGVLRDLEAGWSVLVVGPLAVGRELFGGVVDGVADPYRLRSVRRSSGREYLEHESGGRLRLAATSDSLRGESPAVVVLLREAPAALVDELRPVIATGAEVVQL